MPLPAQGDQIVLSRTELVEIGTLAAHFHVGPAVTAAPQVIYTPGNGFLVYDWDGSGTTFAPIHFATLASHPTVTHADFIVEAWHPGQQLIRSEVARRSAWPPHLPLPRYYPGRLRYTRPGRGSAGP